MEQEIIVSIIARNGLDTAQTVLQIRAANKAKQAEAETDAVQRRKLLAESKKLTKLVKAMGAAETGLNQYLKETAGL